MLGKKKMIEEKMGLSIHHKAVKVMFQVDQAQGADIVSQQIIHRTMFCCLSSTADFRPLNLTRRSTTDLTLSR